MARFNLRSAYLYLVCLITLIIFIVGTIMSVNSLMDVVLSDGGYYQTYEDYAFGAKERAKNTGVSLPSEELKQNYNEYIQREKARMRVQNIKNFISSLSAMLISGGFWYYHWKKIQKEQSEKEE